MADSKITALTQLTSVDGANDQIVVVDVSDTSMAATGTTKRAIPNNLPVSTATQTALNLKANIAAPTLTGTTTVDALAFNTSAGATADVAGKAVWNATDKTFDVNLNGTVVMQVGQETLMRCRNSTGSTITNGSVVYVSGATGNRPTIALADADLSSASKTIGVATEDISNNSDGFITLNGAVRSLNTSGFAAGDTLYLSSTAGAITNVAPTKPARQVTIGTCTVSNAGSGEINVTLNKFHILGELSDVDTTSLASGDVLQWNGTLWVRYAMAGKADVASPTFTGTVTTPALNISGQTASTIAVLDASKNVISAATATYPSLTELAYVKGVTSAVQTQVDAVRTTSVQNSQSADYTLVLGDAGKTLLHPSADTTARTFTIPANASVAYPVGTVITFVCQNGAGNVTIAITSDTMRLAGSGTTGSRTLAANGVATALKLTTTEWLISGTNLT